MSREIINVLLVEDDPADYRLLQRALAPVANQFRIHWSKTLADAVAQLDTTDVDVVICDLSLPDSTGLDTVQWIRANNSKIPVVVLTTLHDGEVEREAIGAGAQDFLVKDKLTSDGLTRAIYHAIQRQEARVENERLLVELAVQRNRLAEQKRLLQQKNRRLRKLYKMAHRFVDNVSHEFRTPLTVIKDYVCLIREGIVGEINDEQREMLDIVGVRSDDLNNMVDDLLDVSKLEAGLLGCCRRTCRLIDVARHVLPGLTSKALVKNVDFEVSIGDDLPEIYCDREKIGRVIINLTTNALKFCGAPGRVRVWAEPRFDQNEVVVAVTDNGSGLDPAQLQSLFKRFKQIATTVKSSCKGFGLGLSIAKELVELNFGRMNVQSAVGAGSTFSFTIPMAVPATVVRRYIDFVSEGRGGSHCVSLIRVATTDGAEAGSMDDLDTFFNYLLRRSDLLLRTESSRWLFLLALERSEVPPFLSRVRKAFDEANRNRPLGPLPEFKMTYDSSWTLPDNGEALSARVLKLLPQAEPRLAKESPNRHFGRRVDSAEVTALETATSQTNHANF